MEHYYKILSLDSGGTYGLVYAQTLRRLEECHPGLIRECDLIAGTSIGGIIALLLADGWSASSVARIIYEESPHVFGKSSLWRRFGFLTGMCAKYDGKSIAALAQKVFGNRTLGSLAKKVMICAFQLDNGRCDRHWKAKFFNNFDGPDSDSNELIVDVARRTSAAPIFFPTVDNYCDGGPLANQPSLSAICQTQDDRAYIQPRPSLNNICLLSIGRGKVISFIPGCNHDWGILRWAWPLVRYVYDKDNQIINYQCKQIIGDRFHRVAPSIDGSTDDIWNLDMMVQTANDYDISPAIQWLKKYWRS